MKFPIDKAETAVVITIALLMASVALMAMPVQPIQPVQAQISGTIGTTPTDIYRYPKLGDLPTGVTPQYTLESTAYMSITPNPIGVGQQALVNVWASPGQPHYFYRQGYKITIQKPDGTTEVLGPFNSYLGDDTAWFQYVVDQVGTWKFKFESPGTYLPAGIYASSPGVLTTTNYTLGTSMYYGPSSTDWQELTVQQEWINSWPSVPIPTDYWTRPVSPENRLWWSILGYYPWVGIYYYPNGRMLYPSNYRYTAYVQAPNTAHVVWKRLGALAGLIGGDAYQYSLSGGGGTPDIIYAGRCYDTLTKPMLTLVNGTYRTLPVTVWECYDLRTGEVYWDLTDVTAPTDVLFEEPVAGVTEQMVASGGYSASLVAITTGSGNNSGRLIKYNPYTGAVSSNVTCLPVGLSIGQVGYVSPGGEYGRPLFNNTYVYSIQTISSGNYRLIKWDARGTSSNFTTRILSNITWPRSSLGAVDYEAGVAVAGGWQLAATYCIGYYVNSTDLNTGAMIYSIGSNDTVHDSVQTQSSPVADRGKFAMAMQNRHWNCWDARTGKKLWESDLTGYPWGNWWAYATASYDFNESKGAIIGCTYDGVYAIDWDTGKILWHYSAGPSAPFEGGYGTYPFDTGVRIADGKIYTYNSEHTASQPLTRGWSLHCINATTGEGIWKITYPMSPGPVADGYLTASSSYDGYMYVFGKGKSATTVTASPKTIAKGADVLIEGTVLDQSPAQPGTPCVSAASMQTQMEYLHMQHPQDGLYHNETITGVPVLLMAFDSSNNPITIGTTTSDVSGTFGMAWTPPNEGVYKISAIFAGDDSYGSSWAETGLSVGPAPASPTPTATPPEAAPDNTGLIYATLAAVIVAIIIGIVAVFVGLRKRQ